MITIALNGCGRIGKNFIRALFSDPRALQKIRLAIINIGPINPEELVYLLRYDSILGTWNIPMNYANKQLEIDGHKIALVATTDYHALSWPAIDWVIDATGSGTHRDVAQLHLNASAKKVLITAPSPDADITIVPGINQHFYDPKKHAIVSLGSCTTNAVAPLLYVLDKAYSIESATLTTIHAYTNSQALLDVNPTHKNPRASRAAALNMIPTTTGASESVGKVLPHLADKISGISLRIPVPDVSLADITCTVVCKPTSREAVNETFLKASTHSLKGILAIANEPLVSSDFKGNPHSVVLDSALTTLQGSQIRIYGWYDNEWGYSNRLKDFLCSVSGNNS